MVKMPGPARTGCTRAPGAKRVEGKARGRQPPERHPLNRAKPYKPFNGATPLHVLVVSLAECTLDVTARAIVAERKTFPVRKRHTSASYPLLQHLVTPH